MVTLPTPLIVTVPSSETVATLSSSDDQATVLSVALSGWMSAVSLNVFPSLNTMSVVCNSLDIVMLSTATGPLSGCSQPVAASAITIRAKPNSRVLPPPHKNRTSDFFHSFLLFAYYLINVPFYDAYFLNSITRQKRDLSIKFVLTFIRFFVDCFTMGR